MNMNISAILALTIAALTLAGCSTFESRARERSETYASLDPGTRQRLERGAVNVGDTEDMVYIALGEPDEKRERKTEQRQQTIWIYRTYWQEYEGSKWVGWRRYIVPGPGNHYRIFHEPVSRDIYRQRSTDVIRVTFADERVTAVDQQTDT